METNKMEIRKTEFTLVIETKSKEQPDKTVSIEHRIRFDGDVQPEQTFLMDGMKFRKVKSAISTIGIPFDIPEDHRDQKYWQSYLERTAIFKLTTPLLEELGGVSVKDALVAAELPVEANLEDFRKRRTVKGTRPFHIEFNRTDCPDLESTMRFRKYLKSLKREMWSV